MSNDKKVSINEQDAPHKEGAYGNTSASPIAEDNVSMGMGQMKEEGNARTEGNESAPTENEMSPGTDGR